MNDKTFSVVFESDIYRVKKIVGEALEFLTGVFPDLSKETLFEIKLVISEALLNAVTHGNAENANKKVSFEIKVESDFAVVMTIEDEGEGFDYSAMMNEKISEKSISREYGRGIRLVCSLSDKVSYNKKGNKIKIYKKVVVDG